MRHVQRREHVLAENLAQVARVHLSEGAGARAADVVDDDVDPTERGDRRRDAAPAPCGSDTSAATPWARPGPSADATAASSAATPRAQKTTSAPSSTSRVAIARPIPRLEPVTSATFPASPRSTRASLSHVTTTRLLLARHGETDWNRTGRWQGQADPPLNDAGRRQAAALAEQLVGDGVAAIYSSDLRRASETARVVGDRLGLPVVERPDLREIDVGSWSGLTRDEVRERFPDGFARWLDGEIGHDGESREQLTTRVVAAIERIAAEQAGGTVLVVTHGGAIRLSDGTQPAIPAIRSRTAPPSLSSSSTACSRFIPDENSIRVLTPSVDSTAVEDYTNKYKGEQVELALFGGEYQEGTLTAYCSIEDVPHVELNGHILVPLQNVASLHCSSRCDAPEPDWPPRGLEELDRDDRPDDEDDEG